MLAVRSRLRALALAGPTETGGWVPHLPDVAAWSAPELATGRVLVGGGSVAASDEAPAQPECPQPAPAPAALPASRDHDDAGPRADRRGRHRSAAGPRAAARPHAGLPGGLRDRWALTAVPSRRAVLAITLVGALAVAVAAAALLRSSAPADTALPVPVRRPAATASPTPARVLVVAVAGAVRRPGVVRLRTGARVEDALRAAGGLRPGADPGLLNLARVLVDGEQVVVGLPTAGAPTTSGGAGSGGSVGGGTAGPIDLNAATVTDLDALPGVGPVLAQRIIDWRSEHGPFRNVEQLREVAGIGDRKFEELRSRVRV